MSQAGPRLSILIVTEDSAGDAPDTVRLLVRHALLILNPACQTHQIVFETSGEPAAKANLWKSRSPRSHSERIKLYRRIAGHLAQCEQPSFVVMHIDADEPWSNLHKSNNVECFNTILRTGVRNALMFRRKDLDAEREIRRLIPLVACYSIESWLYQNTETLVEACKDRGRYTDASLARQWAIDRTALDELIRPKESVCVGSEINLKLATHRFPAMDVYGARKSFHAAVERLRAVDELVDALGRTVGTFDVDES